MCVCVCVCMCVSMSVVDVHDVIFVSASIFSHSVIHTLTHTHTKDLEVDSCPPIITLPSTLTLTQTHTHTHTHRTSK